MAQNVPFQTARPVQKKMPGWGIALVVVSLVLFFFGSPMAFFFGTIFGALSRGSDSGTEPMITAGSAGYVSVLHIEGTITSQTSSSVLSGSDGYNQKYLISTVRSLAKDPTNRGILLFIDSPGGEVYATDELYLELRDYKEETKRPVYAYCASMAASGGYYLACASDEIIMNRNGITGSIGVTAGTFIDISGFLEKQGIKTTSIYVGANKTMGSYFEEFTPEQKEIYTSILKETYDQFVGIVAESRGMSTKDVETLADGRVYSPKQALEKNLVDAILTFDEAKTKMVKDSDLPDAVQFVDFAPKADVGLASLFGAISSLKRTDLDSYLSHLDVPFDGPAYYYPG